jgi:hypothetical protein
MSLPDGPTVTRWVTESAGTLSLFERGGGARPKGGITSSL